VTCSPFAPGLTLFQESGSVNVQQAAGQSIAHASAMILPPEFTILFPCDGNPHTFPVTMSADPTGPPFHGGPAVFNAFANAAAGIPSGCPTCFFNPTTQSGASGPTLLGLH
jgi:hypothetical protein